MAPTPSVHDPVYFVNSRSGGGRGRELLEQRSPEKTVEINPSRILDQLASEAEHHDRIVVAGGDGTFSLIIDAIMQLQLQDRVTLHLVPLGTGNDLARSLGVPIPPNGKSGKLVAKGNRLRKLPVWRYGNRHFVNYLSWGMDVMMLTEVEKYRKLLPTQLLLRKLAFTTAGLRHLGYSLPEEATLIVDGKSHRLDGKAGIIVSNLPYYGGGSRINDFSPEEDRLSVTIVNSGTELLRLGISRYPYSRSPVLPYFPADEIQFSGVEPPTQYDGEIMPFSSAKITLAGYVGIWTPEKDDGIP